VRQFRPLLFYAKYGSSMEEESSHARQHELCFTSLTGETLECILSYLPASYITTLLLTCKYFKNEISHGSSGYWRDALARRGWPFACVETNLTARYLRQTYINHFKVCRRADTIQQAYMALTTRVAMSGEYNTHRSLQLFCGLELDGSFIRSHVWSPTHVLAIYRNYRLMRLYKFELLNDRFSMQTTEVACLMIQPGEIPDCKEYGVLFSAIDDEYVACMISQTYNVANGSIDWVVFVRRRDFELSHSSTGQNSISSAVSRPWTAVSVCDALLEYIMMHEDCQDVAQPIQEYIDGGSVHGKPEINLSGNLCACGSGLFMTTALFSIPIFLEEFDETDLRPVGLKLVMFSAVKASVLWVGDCTPLVGESPFDAIHIEMRSYLLASLTIVFALCNCNSTIMIAKVQVDSMLQEGALIMEILFHEPKCPSNYSFQTRHINICMDVIGDFVVTVDKWKCMSEERGIADDTGAMDLCTLSIYNHSCADIALSHKSVTLSNVSRVWQLFSLSRRHVGVIYVLNHSGMLPTGSTFEPTCWKSLELATIHAESGMEIYRYTLVHEFVEYHDEIPCVSYVDETLCVTLQKGLIALSSREVAKMFDRNSMIR
jgi:hypothetical protein